MVGDIVLLEILQGVSKETDAVLIERLLRAYDLQPMLDTASAIRAARNYRQLRAFGITIRKTADMVIGTFCIDRGLPLLHDDRDFDHMERHLGLQVVRL